MCSVYECPPYRTVWVLAHGCTSTRKTGLTLHLTQNFRQRPCLRMYLHNVLRPRPLNLFLSPSVGPDADMGGLSAALHTRHVQTSRLQLLQTIERNRHAFRHASCFTFPTCTPHMYTNVPKPLHTQKFHIHKPKAQTWSELIILPLC